MVGETIEATEITDTTEIAETTAAADDTKAEGPVSISIRDSVRESLKSVGPRTRDAVIEYFAEQEAGKQAQALIKGLEKLNTLERDYQKINRPDVVTYDAEGKEASKTFSKARIDERKKLQEQIEKLTNAINKADDGNDFSKLYELTK